MSVHSNIISREIAPKPETSFKIFKRNVSYISKSERKYDSSNYNEIGSKNDK